MGYFGGIIAILIGGLLALTGGGCTVAAIWAVATSGVKSVGSNWGFVVLSLGSLAAGVALVMAGIRLMKSR